MLTKKYLYAILYMREYRKGEGKMKIKKIYNINAVTLGTVHTHTHTRVIL